MERQGKGLRGLEAYCKGGQGPPRAVAPPKKRRRSYGEPMNKLQHTIATYRLVTLALER